MFIQPHHSGLHSSSTSGISGSHYLLSSGVVGPGGPEALAGAAAVAVATAKRLRVVGLQHQLSLGSSLSLNHTSRKRKADQGA